ncbi:hypothetical protein FSP39_007240 [Pinctada imbricata]|uniref:PDZ domain-containing protein n=1 Tax=Pinctada imbricata TaxID=66713 RepID=A0AA88XQM9_PINIB|nr:hypothetical protein FSP39_007240 [Pinctada imbricata]
MGSGDIFEVTLSGGAPWGFRLMGGEGFPLEVAKVRKKSKAQHGGLQEGDILLSINGTTMQGKSHEDAMYLVDNAKDGLRIQVQRPGGRKMAPAQAQQPAHVAPSSQGNIVSSASTTYSVKEGDKRRSVSQHEFEEAMQGGIKSKTFVKHEEIVNKPSPRISSQSSMHAMRSEGRSEPMQIYVQVDDQMGHKENISPIPNNFQPHSASSPVPMFSVKNIKSQLQSPAQPPSMTSHQSVEQQHGPTPFQEQSSNIPMFRVSKFEAHKFQERPQRDESDFPKFDPSANVPLSNIPPAPPAPPLPPSIPREVNPDEPMLFPVPKYTSQMLRQDALERSRYDLDSDEEEEEHPDHLPIFAPPVQFTAEERALMDSGYDENLLTPRSVERPTDLPDLDIQSGAESDHVPGTPETGSTGVRKKKKLFSDSAFYDDPDAHYPTIEEQMDLCKKIAKSLTSAANKKARGARMFAKRKRKSGRWIHDGEFCHGSSSAGDVADLRDLESELNPEEGGTKPLFSFRIPNLAKRINYEFEEKMSLSPDEFERLRLGKDKVDHRSVSPNTCHNLVMDLQSPRNRGAKLFQKRAARSEKWVIDETNAAKPPPPRLQNMVSSPAKSMLSPWEAASENPIGSVEKAFEHLDGADKLREVNQTFKQQQQQWRPPQPPMHHPMHPPMTTPYQQTVTTTQKIHSLKTSEKPNVIGGPNYNRLAKGWQTSSNTGSYSSSQYPHGQQHFQTFRQEPPPPPPPIKPLKQQDNYDRSVSSYSQGPHGHTRSTTSTSHHTTPYGGGYGQPQGYTTTDSYNYQMTAVSDF